MATIESLKADAEQIINRLNQLDTENMYMLKSWKRGCPWDEPCCDEYGY